MSEKFSTQQENASEQEAGYYKCPVCRGEGRQNEDCERCEYHPTETNPPDGWQERIKDFWDFVGNIWGIIALFGGVVIPMLLAIVISVALVFSFLLTRNNIDGRLLNLSLLFLIFMIWASLLDMGIILFVYFARTPLYEYHWSWPVRQKRRPSIIAFAGIALAAFLVLGLVASLLPLIWSAEAPDAELFGLTEQYFWHGALVAFLLSISFASFVLFLMFLNVADYIAKRSERTVPPIYMDVNKLRKVVLKAVHSKEYLDTKTTTISMQRTEFGGLKMRLQISPGSPQAPSSPPLSLQRAESGELKVQLQIPQKPPQDSLSKEPPKPSQYEVVSDEWGFLVSLEKKGD